MPLIVAGPGVPPAASSTRSPQNTDLRPTFVELAGGDAGPRRRPQPRAAAAPGGGGARVADAGAGRAPRTPSAPSDPDYDNGRLGGDPTTYEAIRISAPHLPGFAGPVEEVCVEYRDAAREREFYDITRDPFELVNLAGPADRRAAASCCTGCCAGLKRCHDAPGLLEGGPSDEGAAHPPRRGGDRTRGPGGRPRQDSSQPPENGAARVGGFPVS